MTEICEPPSKTTIFHPIEIIFFSVMKVLTCLTVPSLADVRLTATFKPHGAPQCKLCSTYKQVRCLTTKTLWLAVFNQNVHHNDLLLHVFGSKKWGSVCEKCCPTFAKVCFSQSELERTNTKNCTGGKMLAWEKSCETWDHDICVIHICLNSWELVGLGCSNAQLWLGYCKW